MIAVNKKISKSNRMIWQLHLMLLPGILLILIFSYFPLTGIIIAFKDFYPALGIWGSPWVGLENFEYMFMLPDTPQILWNTLRIALLKMIFNFPIPIIVALMLNEVKNSGVKRTIQTIVYLPYFISWVILAGIIIDLFARDGIINQFLGLFGIEPIFFMGDNRYFTGMLILTDVWKNFGYGTVVYLAAIAGVDSSLYESAIIDGANRWKQTLHITLPSITPIIMLLMILNMGNVLNAGFDQIFNLYSPLVYESADIIDTFVYRISMVEANYSLGTAVGLLKSVVSFILIVSSYAIANRYSDYTVF